jgi:hypothetical protein
VAYANSTFGSCSAIGTKTKCIYNPSSTTSAVAKLCARAKADCSKGIVTGGLSQGSIVSVLSRNYDSRVRASMGQGAGNYYSGYDLSSCMNDGKHTQTSDRIRLINGQQDTFVGPDAATVRKTNEATTRFVKITSSAGSGRFCTNLRCCYKYNAVKVQNTTSTSPDKANY